jgi:hypothetical protein
MNIRVVRFTGVTRDSIDALKARIESSGGPPEGVNATRITVAFDERQGTAVVVQAFPTAADMEAGAKVLTAMDPGETPGTRDSVDSCEVVLELNG